MTLTFRRCLLVLLALTLSLSGIAAQEAKLTLKDWPWWRGPNRNGIAAADQAPPTEWDGTKNVLWKVDVPGRGHSSPTIVGSKLFFTTADED